MIDVSIVIVSYNTREITKKCLETIVQSLSYDPTIQAEIILIDNASTDGSIEEIKSQKLKISRKAGSPQTGSYATRSAGKSQNIIFKIIESKANLGFGRGNNEAVKQAQGKYLLFLNSDIEVLDNAIPRLFQFFTNKQNPFAFLGGKLLNKDMTPQPSAGPYYSLSVIFGALFLRGDYWNLTRYSPNKIRRVDWVSGACFMCTKAHFDRLNGFDEKIFMYMEEIDLFYRAKKQNMLIGFYPRAQFIHLGSASSTKRSNPILHVYKGFLYLYHKHHTRSQSRILRFMLQLKAIIAFWIGVLTKNKYLTETYGKALHMAQENR